MAIDVESLLPDYKINVDEISSTILPSDHNWRLKNYYKLLEEQKARGLSQSQEKQLLQLKSWPQDSLSTEPEAKRPKRAGKLFVNNIFGWFPLDVICAATILYNESVNNITIVRKFSSDEDELRRVFLLLYDVFRYKPILRHALHEVGFFQNYTVESKQNTQVFLLLYDLYTRKFVRREKEDQIACENAFKKFDLNKLEENLWENRVKLGAALARHRIRKNALHINLLLPLHMRDETLVSVDNSPVTGWVNTFLISKEELIKQLNDMGVDEEDVKFDHICVKVVSVSSEFRTLIAQSKLVANGYFILQDRSLLLATSMMSQILSSISLNGAVAQTHCVSPRISAYLASLLAENRNIEKIFCFGSGDRTEEYQEYIENLGIKNCEFRREQFMDVPFNAPILESIVAILACPPTSWTGISDPVDLICSRNGDLTILRALTSTNSGPDKNLIDQQKYTLKFSMSMPQVQVVLYEAHSRLKEETETVVKNSVYYMNEWAKHKHEEDQRLLQEQEEAEERAKQSLLPGGAPAQREQREKEVLDAQECLATPKPVEIPDCDLFEWIELPQLCTHGSQCYLEEGCFIAQLRRKELTNLDAKYMIKMAEARGLFGADEGTTPKQKPKREEFVLQRTESSSQSRTPTRRVKIELARISAPTHSSLIRWGRHDLLGGDGGSSCESLLCQRYVTHTKALTFRKSNFRHSLMKQWWREAVAMLKVLLPYAANLSPRTRAQVQQPLALKLPRVPTRKMWPITVANVELDVKSQPADFEELFDDCKHCFRRNSL